MVSTVGRGFDSRCWVRKFSPFGFSSGSLASSHSQKTGMRIELRTLTIMKVCVCERENKWLFIFLCGHSSRVAPSLGKAPADCCNLKCRTQGLKMDEFCFILLKAQCSLEKVANEQFIQ